MKNVTRALASTLVFLAMSSCAFAQDTQKIQDYAHPTMFGSESQQTTTADSAYIVGGKILKTQNKIGVANKDNVLVASWAKDVLNLIKTQSNDKMFNEKMPVLRSELAVMLADAFELNSSAKKMYKDVSNTYWAQKWIYGATQAGVMIGYPDNNFRPDQPVTKAEVFATIAQLIDIKTDRSLIVPQFKGKDIQFIPKWAIAPTKEVVASALLDVVPTPDKVNNDEYLSKEQVAYLVCELKRRLACDGSLKVDANASAAIQNYHATALTVKLADRLSARTSNAGDKFAAKTTKDVVISGISFPAGSVVKGEVVEVSRPGVKNPGYIKVKFNKITNGEQCAEFPTSISQAQADADTLKNPNVVARLFGFPFSGAGRVTGVVGRSGAAAVNVAGNGLEKLGDNLSNAFVDTLSLEPVAGVKNVGNAFVTVGKGVYDICKVAVSGTFGVLYEVTDELRYLIVPAYSNNSSLNPGEELTIVF